MGKVPSVLGHRVLVKPDLPEEVTASGIILPTDRDHVPTSGEVVAIGPDGSEEGYRARQQGIRDCIAEVEAVKKQFVVTAPLLLLEENMAIKLGTAPECDVQIGDRVVFPAECGLDLAVDGETYVILNMDDVCVVMRDEAAA